MPMSFAIKFDNANVSPTVKTMVELHLHDRLLELAGDEYHLRHEFNHQDDHHFQLHFAQACHDVMQEDGISPTLRRYAKVRMLWMD